MSSSSAPREGKAPGAPEALQAWNYCVCFIDLLGQRDAMKGETVLPKIGTPAESEAFLSKLRETVGALSSLYSRAETMLRAAVHDPSKSPYRAKLPPELHATWDAMQVTKITTQRWSDGLVCFACLGDPDVKCHTNATFELLGLSGALCLMGLAAGRPIRGAIEIAWGAELHAGELFGPAVARAYELESEVAAYPRIVVGPQTLQFLAQHAKSEGGDKFAENDRALAKTCFSMLARDVDGHAIVHYLGEGFQWAITGASHPDLYAFGVEYIEKQLALHKNTKNTKLALRYSALRHYFQRFPPSEKPRGPEGVDDGMTAVPPRGVDRTPRLA